MTLTVNILAPAPVRHVPARSRSPRTSYASVVVEGVELRELTDAEAPRGPDLPLSASSRIITRLVDNEMWRVVGNDDTYTTAIAGKRPTSRTFVPWLEGRDAAHETDGSDLGRAMEGTPLLARIPGSRVPHRPTAPWNADKQGKVSLDTRFDTPGRVRAYVAGNIALIGDVPYMRLIGPMVYAVRPERASTSPRQVQLVRYPGSWTSNHSVGYGNLHRFDRIDELMRASVDPALRLGRLWHAKGIESVTLRDDDDLGIMLRETIRTLMAIRPKEEIPQFRERQETLEVLSALGSVGALADADMEDNWEFLKAFAMDYAKDGNAGFDNDQARRIERYAEPVALPRIHGRNAVSDEDMAYLSGMPAP